MWFPGCNLSLTLGSSASYQKTVGLLCGLCIMMVLQSSCSSLTQEILILLLALQGGRLIYHGMPMGQPIRLVYQGEAWWYERTGQEALRFEQAVMVLHVGIFFLVRLGGVDNTPPPPTSRGLSAGSTDVESVPDPADKPKDLLQTNRPALLVVIFCDQLSQADFRKFMWLQRIQLV